MPSVNEESFALADPTMVQRRALLKICAAAFATGMFSFRAVEALGETGAGPMVAPKQAILLRAIADTIIPDTDTPGAIKAGVPDFMKLMVEGWLDPAEGARFLSGLDAFEAESLRANGRSFAALSPAARLAYLRTVQVASRSMQQQTAPVPFFLMVKRPVSYTHLTLPTKRIV